MNVLIVGSDRRLDSIKTPKLDRPPVAVSDEAVAATQPGASPWKDAESGSVAMIEERRKTRIRIALKTPVAIPYADQCQRARSTSPRLEVVGVIVHQAVNDAHRHQRGDGDVGAAHQQCGGLGPGRRARGGLSVSSRLLEVGLAEKEGCSRGELRGGR